MAGASRGSADLMRTKPRLSGRSNVQTPVTPGNGCNSPPMVPAEYSAIEHCESGVSDAGCARTKHPAEIAQAVAHGGLVIARAFLRRSVEIIVARITALLRRLDKGLGKRMRVAQVRNRKRPAGAMELIRAALVGFR